MALDAVTRIRFTATGRSSVGSITFTLKRRDMPLGKRSSLVQASRKFIWCCIFSNFILPMWRLRAGGWSSAAGPSCVGRRRSSGGSAGCLGRGCSSSSWVSSISTVGSTGSSATLVGFTTDVGSLAFCPVRFLLSFRRGSETVLP